MTGLVKRTRSESDRGAAAVEFALVVLPLLVIVFGIINFGFVFSQQSTLNNAVREGARRAVVNDPYAGATSDPRSCDGIIVSIKNELSGLALDNDSVEVKVTQDGGTVTDPCGGGFQTSSFTNGEALPCTGAFKDNTAGSIVVETKYDSTIPVSFPPFPTTLTLTSKAVYRCEFSST